MNNEKRSPSSLEEYEQDWNLCFVLKRIGEKDILLTTTERDHLLAEIARGTRFIQVRLHTIMVNAIKGIDPRWGDPNIPPIPRFHPIAVIEARTAHLSYTKEQREILGAYNKRFFLASSARNALPAG
jgi:hypothetical protein